MLNKNFDNPKGIDLQLFAEVGDADLQAKIMAMFNGTEGNDPINGGLPSAVNNPEGAVVPPTGAQPQPSTSSIPAATAPEGQLANQSPTPVTGQVQPDSADPMSVFQQHGLDKFKTVEDFAKSYKEMEKFKGQKTDEMNALRVKNEEQAAQLAAMNEKMSKQSTVTQDPANPYGEESIDFNDPDALADLQYSDPVKFAQLMEQRAEKRIMEKLQPTLEWAAKAQQDKAAQDAQMNWRTDVDSFRRDHPDADEWTTDITTILQNNPNLGRSKAGLEQAYLMAKGAKYQNTNPTDYLKDESFVKDNILSNEDIKKQVVAQYLTELQNGGTPMSIGNNMTGNVPLTPANKPKTMEEAAAMALAQMKQ